ncbi:hypothetical protein BKA70DRAFT_487152 [Coprinopsis sp. MPI-PUGE-AT-0042]|nr:hypothetical protein BKA70DRAFT_487152 [Coprinopsis sp. MPI-PUGE-AT-0042]
MDACILYSLEPCDNLPRLQSGLSKRKSLGCRSFGMIRRVLLAMPAVWLSWSLVLYICCIMSFLWRSTTFEADPYPFSTSQVLAIRILVTTLLLLGIVYGSLIIATFARYGDAMDQAWKKRINGWIEAQFTETFVDEPEPLYEPLKSTYSLPVYRPWPWPSSSMRGKEKRKESMEELEEELHVYRQPPVNPDGWIPPRMSDGLISFPPPQASRQDSLPEKPTCKRRS